jgi:DNA repair exonuclease SbcCD ATPase subunit
MSLSKLNSAGEIVEDLTGEQRRETEKTLRKLIGTSDDFLMTSLASQGQMNSFIRERATARKMILTNFLDLNVFDTMHDKIKEESSDLRAELRRIPAIDWDAEIDDQKINLQDLSIKLEDANSQVDRKKTILQTIKIAIATQGDIDYVSKKEIDDQKTIIKNQEQKLESLIKRKIQEDEKFELVNNKSKKIKCVREDFPIEEINDKLKIQNDLEKSVVLLSHIYENHKSNLERMTKSAKKLEGVPCGTKFPSCMFIKDSH